MPLSLKWRRCLAMTRCPELETGRNSVSPWTSERIIHTVIMMKMHYNIRHAMDKVILKRLEVECIIGIFPRERKAKQKVQIDLEFPCDAARAARTDHIDDTVDYKRISKAVLRLA